MKISDIGTLKKVQYLIKSLLTPLSWRHIHNAPIENGATKDQQQKYSLDRPLYTFNSPKCLFDWKPCTDRMICGDSTAHIEYNTEEHYLSLRGRIIADNKDKLESKPYIGIELLPWINYKIRLQHFNLIRMRVRTDGSIVRWILMFKSRTRGMQEGTAVMVDTSKEWQVLELPLANFRSGADNISSEPISKLASLPTITSIGLKISSEETKDVKLDISSIQVGFNPAVEQFTHQYRRPIFYKRLASYRNVKTIDNGREMLVRS